VVVGRGYDFGALRSGQVDEVLEDCTGKTSAVGGGRSFAEFVDYQEAPAGREAQGESCLLEIDHEGALNLVYVRNYEAGGE